MSIVIDGGVLGVLIFIATKLQVLNDMSHKISDRLLKVQIELEKINLTKYELKKGE